MHAVRRELGELDHSLPPSLAPHFRSTLNGAEVAAIRQEQGGGAVGRVGKCNFAEAEKEKEEKQEEGYGIVRVFVRAVLAKEGEDITEQLNNSTQLDLLFWDRKKLGLGVGGEGLRGCHLF